MNKPIQRLAATGAKVGGMTSDALSPRMKAKFAPFVKRTRLDGEAAPRIINTQAKGNIYKPAKHLNARSGLAICG